jgi:hypothetical protein
VGVAAWALVISIVAGCTAMASLVWQIVSWRKTGPDVHVAAAQVFGDNGDGSEAHVRIVNKGRTAVQIVKADGLWWAGGYLRSGYPSTTSALPTKLEPHHELEVLLEEVDSKRLHVSASRDRGRINVWLGNNEVVVHRLTSDQMFFFE